jgi:hypothetical protein
MTRKGWVLLMLALGGPGCLTQTAHLEEEAKKMPPVQTVEAPPPRPVVTPDEVTESNAAEKAQALARELDQEQPSAPPVAGAKEKSAKP